MPGSSQREETDADDVFYHGANVHETAGGGYDPSTEEDATIKGGGQTKTMGAPEKHYEPPRVNSRGGDTDGDAGVQFEEDPADAQDPAEAPKPWYGFIFRLFPYGGLAANCFSLASVTLGGGIISMADSFRTSGIIMSVIYLVIIMTITVYTMTLLGLAIQKTGARSYEQMGALLFGPAGGYFVGFVLALSCVGTAIAYVNALQTLMTPILQKGPHTSEYFKSENGIRLVVVFLWAGLLVPAVLPKHLNSVRYVSLIGVCFVLYFVLCIMVHSGMNGMKLGMRGDMAYFTTGNQAIYGLSIFVFGYMCQGIAFPLAFEMKPRFRVRRLTYASIISMGVCTIFYIFAGVFGYFDFADEVKPSILYNFDPIHQPYIMVAYIGMIIKIVAAFCANLVPIKFFFLYLFRWDIETVPYWKHTILVFLICGVVLVAGLFIPKITLAFGLVGSLCGGFIGFIFPAMFFMYCGNWTLRTVGFGHFFGCYFLHVCGVIAIVWGTIATIYSSFIDTD